MYEKLRINKFRLFEDKDIVLGKYITVLAGRNSTGKSTVLGILANAGELKKHKTYTGSSFRAEFSELFHGSETFDPTGSHLMCLHVNRDGVEEDVEFRTTWQTYPDGTKRFRIIPKRFEGGKETAAKLPYPTLYLGLSRLYPIGEAQYGDVSSSGQKWDSPEDKQWFEESYKKILTLHSDIDSVEKISISGLSKKTGSGISTDSYDGAANSAGQDNVGQILLAILSFRKLKNELGAAWKGGILLIDELDATLHPFAQEKIFDLLKKAGKELGIQTVFTTHSTSLLEYACKSINPVPGDGASGIELYYFTCANGALEIKRNPSILYIKSDLQVGASPGANSRKVGVFSEDAEARWLIDQLCAGKGYSLYYMLIDADFGSGQLAHLFTHDFEYLRDRVIVFDGDVDIECPDFIPPILKQAGNNVVKLPGSVRPEQVLYDFIVGLGQENDFWREAERFNYSKDIFVARGPLSDEYASEGNERNRYKKWFRDHQVLFEQMRLVEYWRKENPVEFNAFMSAFGEALIAVAERTASIVMPQGVLESAFETVTKTVK